MYKRAVLHVHSRFYKHICWMNDKRHPIDCIHDVWRHLSFERLSFCHKWTFWSPFIIELQLNQYPVQHLLYRLIQILLCHNHVNYRNPCISWSLTFSAQWNTWMSSQWVLQSQHSSHWIQWDQWYLCWYSASIHNGLHDRLRMYWISIIPTILICSGRLFKYLSEALYELP